jgi:hypothetical protein
VQQSQSLPLTTIAPLRNRGRGRLTRIGSRVEALGSQLQPPLLEEMVKKLRNRLDDDRRPAARLLEGGADLESPWD